MFEDIVVAFEDAVGEPVVAQELPQVLERVEFRRSERQRQRQRQLGDVVGNFEPGGGVPSCLIEDDNSVRAGVCCEADLGETRTHRMRGGPGHDKACAFAFLRADGAEHIARGHALVMRR